MRKEIYLSVNASKKLIGQAISHNEDILDAAASHTIVIIKGSTNAFVADALCKELNLPFDPSGFYRGIIKPETVHLSPMVKNDLVIRKGRIIDKDIYGIASELTKDDIILKGANALNMKENSCAVLIGNPEFGTMAPISAAVCGRRTKLIHPVGLEKRVDVSIQDLCRMTNDPRTQGLRLAPTPGIPYTELDAFADLYHIHAELIAAGGIGGYEGGSLFLIDGREEDLRKAEEFSKANRNLLNGLL